MQRPPRGVSVSYGMTTCRRVGSVLPGRSHGAGGGQHGSAGQQSIWAGQACRRRTQGRKPASNSPKCPGAQSLAGMRSPTHQTHAEPGMEGRRGTAMGLSSGGIGRGITDGCLAVPSGGLQVRVCHQESRKWCSEMHNFRNFSISGRTHAGFGSEPFGRRDGHDSGEPRPNGANVGPSDAHSRPPRLCPQEKGVTNKIEALALPSSVRELAAPTGVHRRIANAEASVGAPVTDLKGRDCGHGPQPLCGHIIHNAQPTLSLFTPRSAPWAALGTRRALRPRLVRGAV